MSGRLSRRVGRGMDRERIDWTRQPVAAIYAEGLRLPSFGINIPRSNPSAMAVPAGWGTADLAVDSGDAFSVSYLHHLKGEASTADRKFEGMDPAFLRRVLLLILDGEEYGAVRDHYDARLPFEVEAEASGEEEVPQSPFATRSEKPEAVAQVRITDLRLAKDLAPKVLERELKSALPDLPVPVTADGVKRWKHETLRKPTGMRTAAELAQNKKWYEEEVERIASVSFAAAALCLFLDLGMADVGEANRDGLADRIRDLAEVVRDLTIYLDKSVDGLSKLLGTGKGGRPPDPDIKHYAALVFYRMGHPAFRIALRIGLSPVIPEEWREIGVYDDEPHGNKNWKSKLRRAIEKGIEVERAKFPVATEVFARGEDEAVKQRALRAYREYRQGHGWVRVADYLPHLHDGDDLFSPRNEGEQRLNALTQLGCCIEKGRDPLRPTLD